MERGGVVRRRYVLRREAPTQQYRDRGRRGWEEWETGQVGLILFADLTDVNEGLKAWGGAVVMGCVCDATTGLGRPVIDATT